MKSYLKYLVLLIVLGTGPGLTQSCVVRSRQPQTVVVQRVRPARPVRVVKVRPVKPRRARTTVIVH